MPPREYYSQRAGRVRPRDRELDDDFWLVLRTYARHLESEGHLAPDFPEACPDGYGTCGVDRSLVTARILMELGEGEWPLPNSRPDDLSVLDYVEFLHEHVSDVGWGSDFHSYFQHFHVSTSNKVDGQLRYREEVNGTFERMGYRYEIRVDGTVVRLSDPVQDEDILADVEPTTDDHLNELIARAQYDFYDKAGDRKAQALEAIVDAFERIKTLESSDKPTSIQTTLEKVSDEPEVREHIDTEMKSLTSAGNSFGIRHHETSQIIVNDEHLVDYLFYRYYNIVRLIKAQYS